MIKRITVLIVALIFASGLIGCDIGKTNLDENKDTVSITSSDIIHSEENESTKKTNGIKFQTVTEASKSDNQTESADTPSTPTETENADISPIVEPIEVDSIGSENNNNTENSANTEITDPENHTISTMELKKSAVCNS